MVSGAASAYTYSIMLKTSDLLKKGRELIQMGDATEARSAFKVALARDLTDRQRARAHNGVCVSFIMEEAWADALEHCNAAIRIVPNNWRFYNNRGNIFLETGDVARALKEYERGLEMAPQSYVIKQNIELAEVRAAGLGNDRPQVTRPT
jgi:Flp pilus assembly protein TadD